MAYIGFIDLFKHATTNVLDDFYYLEGGGTTPTDYPMANAQTRRLGSKYRRTTGSFVDITFQSTNALVVGNEHLMPTLVALLGHNLTVGDQLSVTVSYRINPGTSVFLAIPITAANTDKFNNTFFAIRERRDEVPWKVHIRVSRAFPISAFVDVGRVWMGPMWEVGHPDGSIENLIQEGWKLAMSSGAKSDISIGNQSYTNGAKSFKNLDFKMILTNDDDFIGDGTKGLNETNNALAFINELENGGECIVVPREFDALTTSPSARDSLWATRVGIYGESGKSAHSINQVSPIQYELDMKIKELQ